MSACFPPLGSTSGATGDLRQVQWLRRAGAAPLARGTSEPWQWLGAPGFLVVDVGGWLKDCCLMGLVGWLVDGGWLGLDVAWWLKDCYLMVGWLVVIHGNDADLIRLIWCLFDALWWCWFSFCWGLIDAIMMSFRVHSHCFSSVVVDDG